MSKVLVVSPHCDDSEFGCGGTILKRLCAGDSVEILVFASSNIKFDHSGVVRSSIRKSETARAVSIYNEICECPELESCKLLMAGTSTDFPESQLDTIPSKSLVKHLDELQDSKGYEVWYVPGPTSHQDHRAVYNACMSSLRTTRLNLPSEIYKYEIPNNCWAPREYRIDPCVYEDITDLLDWKLRACEAHKSQIRKKGPLSLEGIEAFARSRGLEVGLEFAEAFEVIKIVR